MEVRDHVAIVVSTLNYENKEDKPLEAVFVFPMPGDAAVCHFSATIGQTQIVAEVKEKQKAREEYDDALSSGESASIRLEYVTELAVQADEGLRFVLPAVLNPRYHPQGSAGGSVQVTSVPASLVPYSLSFSARVSSPRPVSKYLNTEQSQATVKLAAGHKFDRYVELLIYYKDAHQPTAVVEAGQTSAKSGTLMGDPVVMLSLYPEFPQAVMSLLASCGEFVFLLDRSGSMQRDRIKSARDTLLLLLKSLPMGCFFNIYSFGSSHEHIFPKSVEYSQETMEEALKKVGEMEANLGGTEILRPLKDIYSHACIPNQPRQGQRSLIYAQLTGQSPEAAEGSVTVKYKINLHVGLILDRCLLSPVRRLTVHRLAARTLIRSLEMEEMERRGQPDEGVKKKVVELSVQSGVSSTFTAFIAVNKGNGETIQGPLVRRNVPTSMPMMAMCGGGPPGGRMMGRPMPRMMSCSMPMRTPGKKPKPLLITHILLSQYLL
ncbi:hypothetical protein KUCAC02_005796 [Chaenocephalus aceratus]|uniref:Uncharacterized protein n=1 Tax=Chaenocephalus aceratus TaxID=36190 RepID=A0ACB9WQE3_CHAAC|nr:hypothetical protein KUCAC02_005796 [Chaenocephalus aceratus]